VTPLDSETQRILKLAEGATFTFAYEAMSDGSIWSNSGWRGSERRKLTPTISKGGYLAVRLVVNGVRKKFLVHRLICTAFHGPKPTPLHEVRHLDGSRTNNSAANLAWGTRSENAMDRKDHGTECASENGRRGAIKLRGRYNPLCRRGHDKFGRRSCEQCRTEQRRARRG
jgi:hypothetical protein